MKTFINKCQKKINEVLELKHEKIKNISVILVIILCALLSSIEYKIFLAPSEGIKIIPGGVCGISSTISILFGKIFNFEEKEIYHTYLIIDLILNIPCIYLSFRIGRRFGTYTTIYVLVSKLFPFIIFREKTESFFNDFAKRIDTKDSFPICRVLIAACCGGIIESLIFASEASSGGIDTICYFLAQKKVENISSYLFSAHLSIVVSHIIVGIICGKYNNLNTIDLNTIILTLIATVAYSKITSLIINIKDQRFNKNQIQIITKEEKIIDSLIEVTNHTATIVSAKGAYTNENKFIIYMNISVYETDNVINLVKKIDPNSFISIVSVKKICGKFYLKPVR